ncbi:MAG: Co2+/Mg2+ efflux protein ApaG [Bacteroidia bacterium]|jgi:ApaG protein
MPVAITNDIRITVETAYQNNAQNSFDGQHLFAYRIRIENHSGSPVRLLRRHWFISDIQYGNYEVEGEGVVGLQPLIEPGHEHVYVSACSLKSEFGLMHGIYVMERKPDGLLFEVIIPEFRMIVPYRLN